LESEARTETKARILVIEDDADIAKLVRLELTDAGFEVRTAADGVAGMTAIREWSPDLIVLDLGLPGLAGQEIASRVRRSGRTPVIILTARDDVDSKVRLLDLGADDYMVKPFKVAELLARIRVQLRKARAGTGEILAAGRLRIDLVRRMVRFGERRVTVSPKEFELLAFLAKSPGRVFTRPEVEVGVWGQDGPGGSNVVDVHVANIRKKLREAGAFGVIRTVRGVGYALRDGA